MLIPNQMFLFSLQSNETTDTAILCHLIFRILSSFAVIFMYCEIGQRISNAFDEIDFGIGQLNWHSFPIDTWNILPNIIIAVKKPTVFRAFGTISCDRDTFKKVKEHRLPFS